MRKRFTKLFQRFSKLKWKYIILMVVSTCSVYSLPFGGDLECSANILLEGKSCWLIEFKRLGSGYWGKRRGLLRLWNRRQTKQCPSLRTSYEIYKHVAQNEGGRRSLEVPQGNEVIGKRCILMKTHCVCWKCLLCAPPSRWKDAFFFSWIETKT